MSLVMLFTMVVCFALTISVAVSIGLAAVLGVQISGVNMLISVKEIYSSINKFPLAAIPFFILAGNIMETGGISRRLVDFAKSIVGGVQGGLPMTCVLTCMIFAAVSGSSVATTFAIGAILIPALIKHGYPKTYAASLQATSAELGVIIPPSIPMILYGVSAEVSIGELFIAGFGPGVLIGGALMLFVWAYCKYKGWGKNDGDGRLSFGRATVQAGWALMMPVIILGGILTGIVTPTEAAAIAVLYAVVVGMLVFRTVRVADLLEMCVRTARVTGIVFLIIASASILSWWMTFEQIPQALAAAFLSVSKEPWAVKAMILALLFVIGMVLDINAALIILAPVLGTLTASIGMDPVHAGIMIVLALNIGLMTPPVGACLFVLCSITGEKLENIAKSLWPFIIVETLVLVIITFWSDLAMLGPRLLLN